MVAIGEEKDFPPETKPKSIDLPVLLRAPGAAQAQKGFKKACIVQMAVDPNLHVACKTVPTMVDVRSIVMAAVKITIRVHEQYLSPDMVGIFKASDLVRQQRSYLLVHHKSGLPVLGDGPP